MHIGRLLILTISCIVRINSLFYLYFPPSSHPIFASVHETRYLKIFMYSYLNHSKACVVILLNKIFVVTSRLSMVSEVKSFNHIGQEGQ